MARGSRSLRHEARRASSFIPTPEEVADSRRLVEEVLRESASDATKQASTEEPADAAPS